MQISTRPSLSRTVGRLSAATLALVIAAGSFSVAAAQNGAHRAAGPSRGGSITDAFGLPMDCIDAAKSGELQSISWAAAMTDNIVEQDAKGKFIPDLATKWKFSNHGKTLTFDLRHGVTFTNGDAMNATAVAANLRRPDNSFALGPLSSVTTSGKYKVTMNFSAPYRPILSNLAFLVPIYDPKTIGSSDCETPVLSGTGPFKVTGVGPGLSSLTMKSYSHRHFGLSYGHNSGRAYLSTLNITTITDPAQAVSELLSGQVDIAAVAGSQLPRVQGNKNITLHRGIGQSAWWLNFNCAHKPFNNPKVRFAIGEAISRTAIIKTGLSGLGKQIYSIVPPSEPFSDPSAKSYAPPYNPKAAKKVFAKYHVKGPYTLLGYVGSSSTAAEAIASALQAVGLKITVVLKDITAADAQGRAGAFDLQLKGYGATDPDFLYVQFDSKAATGPFATNDTFYKSKAIDSLLVKGREAVGAAAARKDYYAAERLIVSKAVIADPIYEPINITGVASRVGGYHRNIFNLYPLWQDLYVK